MKSPDNWKLRQLHQKAENRRQNGQPGVSDHISSHRPVALKPAHVSKTIVGEWGEVWQTRGSFGQAGKRVGFTCCEVLLTGEKHTIVGVYRGVQVIVVVGSQEKTDRVSHGHSVGNILRVWNVKEASSYPGNQVLGREEPQAQGYSRSCSSSDRNTHGPVGRDRREGGGPPWAPSGRVPTPSSLLLGKNSSLSQRPATAMAADIHPVEGPLP